MSPVGAASQQPGSNADLLNTAAYLSRQSSRRVLRMAYGVRRTPYGLTSNPWIGILSQVPARDQMAEQHRTNIRKFVRFVLGKLALTYTGKDAGAVCSGRGGSLCRVSKVSKCWNSAISLRQHTRQNSWPTWERMSSKPKNQAATGPVGAGLFQAAQQTRSRVVSFYTSIPTSAV